MDEHAIRQALTEHALRFHRVLCAGAVYHTPPTEADFLGRVQTQLARASDAVLQRPQSLTFELLRFPALTLLCVSDCLAVAIWDGENGYEAVLSGFAELFAATPHRFAWTYDEPRATVTYALDGTAWSVGGIGLHQHVDEGFSAQLYRRLDAELGRQQRRVYDVETWDLSTLTLVVPATAVERVREYLIERDDPRAAPYL